MGNWPTMATQRHEPYFQTGRINGCWRLGWSEKSESRNCQKFQAVSEPRYHSEFRTVDEIEIRPFFICEIGLTFLQLKTIERFQWVRFQFRRLF